MNRDLVVVGAGIVGASVAYHAARAGATVTLVDALRQPPEWAIWAPGDGAVDPVGVTERLVAGARAHGARVHPDTPVTPVTAVRRDATGRVVGVETAA